MKILKAVIPMLLTCCTTVLADMTVTAHGISTTYHRQGVDDARARLRRGFEPNERLSGRADASLPTGCDNVPVHIYYPDRGASFVAVGSMCFCTVDGELTAESSARLENTLRTDSGAIAAAERWCEYFEKPERGADAVEEALPEFVYFTQNIEVSTTRDATVGRVLV